jgi:hypothetical protein
LHMLRPSGLPWVRAPQVFPGLRRARSRDSSGLIRLVRSVVPASHRPLLEFRRAEYRPGWERTLDCWLEGRREGWWVIGEGNTLHGGVRALHERKRRPDRIEVLVAPAHSGKLEDVLVQQGLACLHGAPRKVVESVLPSPTEALVAAMEAAGFRKLRVLVQMRLDLVRRIPVRRPAAGRGR